MPRAVSEPQGSQADAWRGKEFGNLEVVLHKFCLVGAKVNSLTALAQFRRGCKPARACAASLYHSKEGSPKMTILQPFLGDCQVSPTENSRAISPSVLCRKLACATTPHGKVSGDNLLFLIRCCCPASNEFDERTSTLLNCPATLSLF